MHKNSVQIFLFTQSFSKCRKVRLLSCGIFGSSGSGCVIVVVITVAYHVVRDIGYAVGDIVHNIAHRVAGVIQNGIPVVCGSCGSAVDITVCIIISGAACCVVCAGSISCSAAVCSGRIARRVGIVFCGTVGDIGIVIVSVCICVRITADSAVCRTVAGSGVIICCTVFSGVGISRHVIFILVFISSAGCKNAEHSKDKRYRNKLSYVFHNDLHFLA